jgi:anti-sigma regulatory factor (Ser/Thr protein kinase)
VHDVLAVTETSQVSAARFAAQRAAANAGWSDDDGHRAGLVATEMASNLVKHSGAGGEILLSRTPDDAIELIALDRGPGIRDIAGSLRDGQSTSGSSGTGLGAIRRLAQDFDIYSEPRHGTAIVARLRSGGGRAAPPAARPARFTTGGIAIARTGETMCGDEWAALPAPDGLWLCVVDGLGHGPLAADASRQAVAILRQPSHASPVEALRTVHAGLRATRGAAGGILALTHGGARATFIGVGNIAGRILSTGSSRHLVCSPGTLGHDARQFRAYDYPWDRDALAIVHSDGVTTSWGFDAHPGLPLRDPSLIAAVLYRDFGRQRDDVSIVVTRERP